MIAYVAVRKTDGNASGEWFDLSTASGDREVCEWNVARDNRDHVFLDLPVLRIARVRITEEPI